MTVKNDLLFTVVCTRLPQRPARYSIKKQEESESDKQRVRYISVRQEQCIGVDALVYERRDTNNQVGIISHLDRIFQDVPQQGAPGRLH